MSNTSLSTFRELPLRNINKFRQTKNFCIIGQHLEAFLAIDAWAKNGDYALIAVGHEGRQNIYTIRAMQKSLSVTDYVLQYTSWRQEQPIEILDSCPIID